MKQRLITAIAIVLSGFLTQPVLAQEPATGDAQTVPAAAQTVLERWSENPGTIFDASEINLNDLVFVARPVVVFADSANDPQFIRQIALLQADLSGLALRDVIIIVDTDPAARSPLRTTLRPRGFGLVLIDKDGRISQRKPSPWDVRELTRAIDKMPSRLQDIDDRQNLAQ